MFFPKLTKNRCLALAALQVAALMVGSDTKATLLNTNIILNGGSETVTSTTADPDGVADFAGWTRTNSVYSDTYAKFPCIFLGDTTHADFGLRYFFGGLGASTQLRQDIDVSDLATTVDAADLRFSLTGWIGTQDVLAGSTSTALDTAEVRVTFKDSTGTAIGTTSLLPLTLGEVRPDHTVVHVVKQRTSYGGLPAFTRSIQIDMLFLRQIGTINNGSVDDLRLTLSATDGPSALVGDINLDHVVDQLDLNIVTGHWQKTNAAFSDGDINGDNIVDQLDLNAVNANWQNFGVRPAMTVVPEPAALSAVALFLVAATRQRRTVSTPQSSRK